MKQALRDKLIRAYEADPEIVCSKEDVDKTLGSDPHYLNDVFGITKSDLIRLERLGLALKARYETRHPKADLYNKLNEVRTRNGLKPEVCKTGTHRVRWLIFKEGF